MSVDDIDRQIEMTRSLYDQQVARRDTIRGTLAVPLALLSFSAFGFGALASRFVISFRDEISAALTFAAIWFLASGVFGALRAMAVIRQLDYSGHVPNPDVLNFGDQLGDMKSALQNSGIAAIGLNRQARTAVLRSIDAEYRKSLNKVETKNRQSLALQKRALDWLLFGLAGLILAIVVVGALGLSLQNGQFPAAT